jgi:predicted flap endonuclease-1-like 5' DNA nuclease
MDFDLQTTLIVAGAAIAVVIILWLLLRKGWRRQSIQTDAADRIDQEAGDGPYVASKERPYVKPPAPPPATVETGVPAREDQIDVSQPPVPLPGDFAGIAFPPHSTDHPDELTRLKGVGPKLASLLNEQGITRYEQLASIDEAELAALEDRLGAFKGRLTRDRVVEQARYLASGDTAAFEEKFGKLGG